jgi:hypothetical protein
METEKILKLIYELNSEYYEKTQDDEIYPFEYCSNGDDYLIKLLGEVIVSTSYDGYYHFESVDSLRTIILKRSSTIAKNLNYLIQQ